MARTRGPRLDFHSPAQRVIDVREIHIIPHRSERRRHVHASSWLASLAIHGIAVAVIVATAAWGTSARIAARTGGIGSQASLAAPTGDPWGSVESTAPELVSSVVVSPQEATIDDHHFVVEVAPARPALTELRLTAVAVDSAAAPPRANESIPTPTAAPLALGLPRQHAFPHVDGTADVNSMPASSGAMGDSDPSFSGNAPPIYPEAAIAAGWEGEVLLRVHIDRSGHVERVDVARSSGHAVLDGAAVLAVSRWRGQPAYAGGVAVATVEVLPVRFQLRLDD